MLNIKYELVQNRKEKPDQNKLGFGRYFTDHMFIMDYTEGKGWHDARIVPYGPLSLDPACMVFHYAQEMFEGLKAYRTPDGTVQLFRPDKNIERMNNTNERLCIPKLEPSDVLDAIKALVATEEAWVPSVEGTSLYIRPFIIATDVQLGVHPSKSYKFMIILSPVGSYYPEGIKPVKIFVENEYVRAVKGGTGFAKVGGNYACSLRSLNIAHEQGYKAVLYLDPATKTHIDEFNSSNFFAIKGNKYITPKSDSILPSITNMSLETVAAHLGMEVERRPVHTDELSTFEEVGECGTAVVITPVHKLVDKPTLESEEETVYTYGDGKCGPKSLKLYNYIVSIQKGEIEDPFGWITYVE